MKRCFEFLSRLQALDTFVFVDFANDQLLLFLSKLDHTFYCSRQTKNIYFVYLIHNLFFVRFFFYFVTLHWELAIDRFLKSLLMMTVSNDVGNSRKTQREQMSGKLKIINLQTKNSERSQHKTLNDVLGDDNLYLYTTQKE